MSPSAKNTEVAVVIVSYNGERWIRKCLDSIASSTVVPNVIIVDNASADSTVQILNHDYPDIPLIRLKKNLGFGQANNLGIRHALDSGYEYVFLVNQDTHLSENCIGELLDMAKVKTEYGVLSPLHLTYDGRELNPSFAGYLAHSGRQLVSDLVLGKPCEIIDVSFVAAAFWFVRRDVFEKVGGFAPVYFLYGEDDDLMVRIRTAGWKAGVVPVAKAYHYHTNSSSDAADSAREQRDLRNQFLEILMRSDCGSLVALFRFLRRWVGLIGSRMLLGYGPGVGNCISAAMEVIKKVGDVIESRRTVGPARFLDKAFIDGLLKDAKADDLDMA